LMHFKSRAAGSRVLVIEDDDVTRTMMGRMLRGEGWEVAEAANGREGLERVADHGHIPVIIVTAADLTEDDRARLNGGVSYILEKSAFEQNELLGQIRRLVANHASALKTGTED